MKTPYEPIEADLSFHSGEIVFLYKRLELISNVLRQKLAGQNLSEKEGLELLRKIRAMEVILNFFKEKGHGISKEDFKEDLEVLLVSENDDGVNGSYLCSTHYADTLREALIETEHIVTTYWVVPTYATRFIVDKAIIPNKYKKKKATLEGIE